MSGHLVRVINEVNGAHIVDLKSNVIPRKGEFIEFEDHTYEVYFVKHHMHDRASVPTNYLHNARTTLRVKKLS